MVRILGVCTCWDSMRERRAMGRILGYARVEAQRERRAVVRIFVYACVEAV